MKIKPYIDKIVKPSANMLLNIIPGKKGIARYLRVAFDLLLPWRTIYPEIVMVTTTGCTLKCKNCNNLMPYYHSPYSIDTEELKRDFDRIMASMDTCVRFSLIGGEPFIYPHLKEMLTYVLNNKKIMYVGLVTNATIIPDGELLEILKNPRIVVSISNYGVPLQKVDELIELFRKNGVRYIPDNAASWVKPGGTEFRGKSLSKLKKEYAGCFSSRYCRTLLKGKLFLCARGAHLYDLGYMQSAHDYFDIREGRTVRDFKKEMLEFTFSDYADACNYCDHALKEKVKPGEQL